MFNSLSTSNLFKYLITFLVVTFIAMFSYAYVFSEPIANSYHVGIVSGVTAIFLYRPLINEPEQVSNRKIIFIGVAGPSIVTFIMMFIAPTFLGLFILDTPLYELLGQAYMYFLLFISAIFTTFWFTWPIAIITSFILRASLIKLNYDK